MALDVMTQTALAADARFINRVKNALHEVSWQVLNESSGTPGHAQRASYARSLVQPPATPGVLTLDSAAIYISKWIVGRTNVISGNVTVDLTTGAPVLVCDVTDAALQSQLSTDWSFLSGAA